MSWYVVVRENPKYDKSQFPNGYPILVYPDEERAKMVAETNSTKEDRMRYVKVNVEK